MIRLPSARIGRFTVAAAALGLLSVPALAQTPQLPPGAQPGATQPRDLAPPLPIDQEPFAFRIPPVLERPLGVDEGARVFVRSFEVRGILQDPNAPDIGPRVRALVAREFEQALEVVEEQRLERQRIAEVGDDGFTPDERRRIVEFMQRQVTELSPERRVEEYERFVDELGLARLERQQGLTIGQIQQVADAVTELYQEAGFFLARAVVPAQDVVDGVVVIQVLEGRMGEAVAENNRIYADGILVRPFAGLEGQLITVAAMEDALLTLSDYPGLQAFGTFRPGREVGTADIVVNVQDERRFGFNTRADNHGTGFTGEYRLATTMDVNNLIGRGDQFVLTAMRTFSPSNTTLGQVHYRMPLRNPRNRLIFDVTRNTFDIASPLFVGADFGGLSTSGMLGFERAFSRGRQFNSYGQFDLTRKRGESTQAGNVFSQDDLAVVGVQYRWDRILAAANALESGFVRFDHGIQGRLGVPARADVLTPGALEVPPSRIGAAPDFRKLTAGYSRMKQVSARNTILFRFAGQYSDDMLTSMEQFSVGGANQVRAAPVSVFLGDKGVFGSFEWIIRLGQRANVSVFHDHSLAYVNEPLRPEDRRFSIGGSGVGLNLLIGQRWDFRVQHARLTGGARPGTGPTDPLRVEDSSQTWLDLNFRW